MLFSFQFLITEQKEKMYQAQSLLFGDILELAVMSFHHLTIGNNIQMARNPL